MAVGHPFYISMVIAMQFLRHFLYAGYREQRQSQTEKLLLLNADLAFQRYIRQGNPASSQRLMLLATADTLVLLPAFGFILCCLLHRTNHFAG